MNEQLVLINYDGAWILEYREPKKGDILVDWDGKLVEPDDMERIANSHTVEALVCMSNDTDTRLAFTGKVDYSLNETLRARIWR